MYKFFFVFFLSLIIFYLLPATVSAQDSAFVSVVNPVRGGDFWEDKNQTPAKTVLEQIALLNQSNIQPTWLLRYDALADPEIISTVKKYPDSEKGLFLEVTPTWANQAGISYHKSESWHFAGSAFLTGYEREEREKLIDEAFEKFKEIFEDYPTSVGAWWIDGYSLEYMQRKYGITAALIVADQYSTDNYQIWGQFWSTPYYPSKRNAIEPAKNIEDKLPLVMMQWAARDPVNGYGNGVSESTYSIQANDYLDYHNLTTDYFSAILDIYTKQKFNQFAHVVVGLENSYSWTKYGPEYKRQIDVLIRKRNEGQFSIVTMKDFADWYMEHFPQFSPPHIIDAADPLGTEERVVWFMNLNYRAGWFYNKDGSVFRDIRQYTGGEEICLLKRCDQVNFATSATRVLDEVSFGHKWIVDEGKITNFKVTKKGDNFILSYINEAGNQRSLELLDKDIGVDGKTLSIDSTILGITEQNLSKEKMQITIEKGSFKWSLQSALFKLIKFISFLLVLVAVPYILINKIYKQGSLLQKIFLAMSLGLVSLTLLFYLFSLVGLKQLIYVYIAIAVIALTKIIAVKKITNQLHDNLILPLKQKLNLLIIGIVLAGTIFQVIPTFSSGLLFPYGLGFWGPNTHDGVWHVSLINQLIKSVPPQNPILGGEVLKNYHYFYDLLVAATSYILDIGVSDLVFRFYPILFSLLLGIGSYYLIWELFNKKVGELQTRLSIIFALYLIYFAGSFGWIVEQIKGRGFGGESNFWANQSISFNLNPPFAISLVLVIAIIQLLIKLNKFDKKNILILILLCGSLISFKAYAGFLVLISLLIVGILRRSLNYLIIFIFSLLLSASLFFSNFSLSEKLIIFSPFWFIHSMIDSPDRVGWMRFALARETGFSQGNWFKFITAEVLSLFVFIVGNLGTRVIGAFSLLKFKTIFQTREYLFMLIFSAASLTIPILFIQAGNPWNTIQFIYYFLYISAISGGIVLLYIFCKWSKLIAIPVTAVILIITPINSWATANGYLYFKPHAFIPAQELEALQFLESQSEGVVLTYPYDEKLKLRFAEPWPLFVYDSTAYVGAFSKKSVYVEDDSQNQILLTDYKKRLVASKDFFAKSGLGEDEFLDKNRIKYIYIPNIFEVKFNEQTKKIKLIFENKQISIYGVENR